MYMTREKNKSKFSICFWNIDKEDLFIDDNGDYYSVTDYVPFYISMTIEQFKQLFPKQKLPHKGSCKYVELKLYIP